MKCEMKQQNEDKQKTKEDKWKKNMKRWDNYKSTIT